MALDEKTSPSSATGGMIGQAEAGVRRCRLHRLRRAAAILAEEKVMPDDDVPDAEPIDQHPVDELIGRQRGKTGIEGKHDGEIEADAIENRQLLRQRRQVKVRLLGVEEFARMRLEN